MKRYCSLGALAILLCLTTACGTKDPGATAEPAPKAEKAFSLEKGTAVALRLFTAPASAKGGSEDLPTLFHDQLVFALHDAGLHAEDAAVPAAAPATGLNVAPLTADDEKAAAGDDAAGQIEQAEPAKTAEKTPTEEKPDAPRYVLEGRITTYHAWARASPPARATGDYRPRAGLETACVYRLIDTETGTAVLSGTAKGAGARAAAEKDASVKDELAHKAFAAMAEQIANRLTGKAAKSVSVENGDRDDYQDSPGKQLKPKPAVKR